MIHVHICGEPENRRCLAERLGALPDLAVLPATAERDGEPLVPPGADLVVVDARPGTSAPTEHLRRLRASPGSAPVAVVTSLPAPGFVADCLSAGAAGILHRDLDPAPLMSAIRILVSGGKVVFTEPGPPPPARADVPASPAGTVEPDLGRLTARQREVLYLIAVGLTNAEISRRLGISGETVKEHVSAVLRTLGVPHRISAALLVHRSGLLERLRGG